MKLRTHLLVLTIATLVPMVLFAVGGAFLLAERERAAFRRGATERVRALMTAVDADLRGSIMTLEAMATFPAFDEGDLEAFRTDAARILRTQREWINIIVSRPSGEQLMNLLVPPGKPLPAATDPASVVRAAQTGRAVVGDVAPGAANRPFFAVRAPVIRDGKSKYVLTAVVARASVERLLGRQGFPNDWVAGVIDGRYRFVARTHEPPGSADYASESLRRALTDEREGWLPGRTLEGVESFRAFTRSSYSGWSTSMAIPRSAVNRSGIEAAWLLGLGVLIAMLAGAVLALLLARRITKPIASLAAAAPSLGQGDPSAAPPASKVDEVRDLAQALHDAGQAIRKREAHQKEAEEALRAADRAKNEFLAMLGHELRNPLATLSTAAELLKIGRRQDGIIEKVQTLIARQTGHMAHLVDDLLEVSRVTGGKIRLDKEPLNLAEIAARVVGTWRDAGRLARHKLAESLEPVWILADAARIEQIISNLLDNALKYTPEGGSIEVRVRPSGTNAGGDALVEVADDGPGLAPELIGRVFDLFVQGERGLARQQGGLGIGLTLVKRLAELHKGSAKVSSAGPGKGATFTVTFPSIPPPARDATLDVGEAVTPSGKRVLVVEDNKDARDSLVQLLGLIGHDVSGAVNATEGLRLVAATRPDVALIDIGLPDLSGYEFARRLRESPEGGRMSLIALTGYGKDEDRARALAAGFDEHLTKPVALERLERLLKDLPCRQ